MKKRCYPKKQPVALSDKNNSGYISWHLRVIIEQISSAILIATRPVFVGKVAQMTIQESHCPRATRGNSNREYKGVTEGALAPVKEVF